MKKLFYFLLPYIRPYRTYGLWALFFAFPFAGIKGLHVYLVKYIVDTLKPGSTFQQALWLAAVLFGINVVNYPVRYLHFYLMRFVVERATCDMRFQLYQKLQRLPMSFFSKNKSGVLVSNVINDTSLLSQGFRCLIDIIREPLTALVMLGMAVYQDWQLTIIIVITAPIFILVFVRTGRLVRNNQERVQEELAKMTHNLSEGISGQRINKAFNLQDYVVRRFDRSQDDFFKFLMKMTRVEEHSHPIVEVIGALAFAGVIVFAHHRVVSGAITPGAFFGFITALALIMDPIRKYSQANVRVNQARAAGERIAGLMALPEEIDSGTQPLSDLQTAIEFRDVVFSYDGERDVVQGLNLLIRRGERVGIVGLSGAGKSTLLNMLYRFYPLKSGQILLDGHPIEEYKLESLRSIFGLVSQELFLFHDTIRENISVGKKHSEAELQEALTIAGAQEFVADLPKEWDTVIGDRGTRLSGGQAQRITIARAILQNPSVLLFDEATSALDHQSEKVVQEALERWSHGKTVLAIAHRLSTIQNFDKIVVLKEGRVVEEGTHGQLLELKGEYFKLYQLGQKEE